MRADGRAFCRTLRAHAARQRSESALLSLEVHPVCAPPPLHLSARRGVPVHSKSARRHKPHLAEILCQPRSRQYLGVQRIVPRVAPVELRATRRPAHGRWLVREWDLRRKDLSARGVSSSEYRQRIGRAGWTESSDLHQRNAAYGGVSRRLAARGEHLPY